MANGTRFTLSLFKRTEIRIRTSRTDLSLFSHFLPRGVLDDSLDSKLSWRFNFVCVRERAVVCASSPFHVAQFSFWKGYGGLERDRSASTRVACVRSGSSGRSSFYAFALFLRSL